MGKINLDIIPVLHDRNGNQRTLGTVRYEIDDSYMDGGASEYEMQMPWFTPVRFPGYSGQLHFQCRLSATDRAPVALPTVADPS